MLIFLAEKIEKFTWICVKAPFVKLCPFLYNFTIGDPLTFHHLDLEKPFSPWREDTRTRREESRRSRRRPHGTGSRDYLQSECRQRLKPKNLLCYCRRYRYTVPVSIWKESLVGVVNRECGSNWGTVGTRYRCWGSSPLMMRVRIRLLVYSRSESPTYEIAGFIDIYL